MTRGALPSELRAVLLGLQGWASLELGAAQGNPALASRIEGLVEVETQRYEHSIGVARPASGPSPQGSPSLGSIFANAQTTSKEVPWANLKYKQVGSLTCVYCGGPQEQPMDFMCKYCRRPIAGATKPTA
jgi:hypothetical protein